MLILSTSHMGFKIYIGTFNVSTVNIHACNLHVVPTDLHRVENKDDFPPPMKSVIFYLESGLEMS